jgi:hypothetical protein
MLAIGRDEPSSWHLEDLNQYTTSLTTLWQIVLSLRRA